jgi:hypothetical protein
MKSSPRWKTLREPRIRFLVGRIGAEKGEGNIGLRKEPRRDTLDDGGTLAAACAATVKFDLAGTGD